MQDTSANPYTVRLNSARLVNAYMGDLRLAGSRRNTQEDHGEERTYKVTINTASPLLNFVKGIGSVVGDAGNKIQNDIHKFVSGPQIEKDVERTTKDAIAHLNVLSNLPKNAALQRAKSQEILQARELKYGKITSDMMSQPHEGAVVKGLHEGPHLESWGAVVGNMAVGAFSRQMKHGVAVGNTVVDAISKSKKRMDESKEDWTRWQGMSRHKTDYNKQSPPG
jgi:hypothetical protein